MTGKQCLTCGVLGNYAVADGIFRLDCGWPGAAPRAGQFFMVKPKRSSVFLPRPISVSAWEPAAAGNGHTVQFLVAARGKGTAELAELRAGESVELTGPLGNAWADFLPRSGRAQSSKPIALIGGGIGIAPLEALAAELPKDSFDFYAGFKAFQNRSERNTLLGPVLTGPANLIVATENGKEGLKGTIPGFLNPADYSAVCACGPQAMLRAVAEKCAAAGVPCYVSLERRMACGVGACLGCTVTTTKGNRRCCTDGPVFSAAEVLF